jgi:predicted transcriptional regulator
VWGPRDLANEQERTGGRRCRKRNLLRVAAQEPSTNSHGIRDPLQEKRVGVRRAKSVDRSFRKLRIGGFGVRPKVVKQGEKRYMLTDLEMKLMNKVWAVRGEVTVSDVHYEMLTERRIAYTTVKTVMDRLVNKKILSRRNKEGTYHYKALVDAKTVADYWKKYIQENIAGGSTSRKKKLD